MVDFYLIDPLSVSSKGIFYILVPLQMVMFRFNPLW